MRKRYLKAIVTIILITTLGGCGVKPMDSQDSDSINTYDKASSIIETSSANVPKNENQKTSSVTSGDSASKKESHHESAKHQGNSANADKDSVSCENKITTSCNDVEIIEYNVEWYEPEHVENNTADGAPLVKDEISSSDTDVAEDTDNDIDKASELVQSTPEYSASDLQFSGVIYWGGWRWTWYSQNVLPGGGLAIPGRHVDENGYVCDENDYICLAATSLSKGTVVDTPFGKQGKVYDSGCAYGTLDVYVSW